MQRAAAQKVLIGVGGAIVTASLAAAGIGSATIANATYSTCGGDQIPNPEYESDYGYHPRCVDTLEPNVPGAYGPDGYTPCTGDAQSRRSPFCSDPNGSF